MRRLGCIHYYLCIFGQRVRLTENISADHRLVQEAEGTALFIVPDPHENLDATCNEMALEYCPLGVWVCFDDIKTAPLAEKLETRSIRRLVKP